MQFATRECKSVKFPIIQVPQQRNFMKRHATPCSFISSNDVEVPHSIAANSTSEELENFVKEHDKEFLPVLTVESA